MIKRKILIVVGSYRGFDKPNGLIVRDLRESFFEQGYDVHVLSIEDIEDRCKFPKDEPHISSIYVRKNNGILGKLYRLLFYPKRYLSAEKKLKKQIKHMDNNYNYNIIISVISPMETASAVYKYGIKDKKNKKSILYELDPTSNLYKKPKTFLEKKLKKRSLSWEKRIYSNFNLIVHMKSHEKYYSTDEFKPFYEKTIYLDLPSLVNPVRKYSLDNKNKKITFLYAGRFYLGLREPFNMLELFLRIEELNNVDFKFSIYTDNISNNNIKNLISNKRTNIAVYDLIDQRKLDDIISKFDFLVSVGNRTSDFVPSKIFYYISKLKPIIHFYSDPRDPVLNYLNLYPYSLCLDENHKISENIDLIQKFIEKINSYKKLEFDANKIFYENTPNYVTKKIMDGVDKND